MPVGSITPRASGTRSASPPTLDGPRASTIASLFEASDADEILRSIREGTEAGNAERTQHGFAALHVSDWSERPRYDRSTHRLVWALGAVSDHGTSINYNTRVLGRRGVVSLNLVTAPEHLAADKTAVTALLEATSFDTGARYQDFNRSTDRVAEYGLAALVADGARAAALKVGLFVKLGKILLVTFLAANTFIVLPLAGAAAWVRRLLGRETKAAPMSAIPAPPFRPAPTSYHPVDGPPPGMGAFAIGDHTASIDADPRDGWVRTDVLPFPK